MSRRLATRLIACVLTALLVGAIGWASAYAVGRVRAHHTAHHKGKHKHARKHKHRRKHARRHKRSRVRSHSARDRRTRGPRPAPTPTPPKPPTTTTPSPSPQPSIGPLDIVTPFPTGQKLFAPTSVWNAALPANAPLAVNSGALAQALSAEVRKEYTSVPKSGPWINTTSFSVADYTVGADVPRTRVALDTYNPQLQRDFDSVPIPNTARVAQGTNGSLGDGHLVVYQPATDTLWEFWLLHKLADGWHAAWGGKMTGVSASPGYFSGSFGASGTGLPLLGGLMTIRELQAGRIDHALAFGIPNTAAGAVSWPAQRGDGRTTGPSAVPEGTHFRIDPSVDLTKLGMTPTGLAIARAAQRYGFIVRDTSGCVTVYAEDPGPTGTDPYGQIFGGRWPFEVLAGFPWDRLQVVAPRQG